jgi:outer membrane receptor protein involved in Fe transport
VFGQKWNAVYGGVYLQDEMAFFDRRLLINVAGRYEGIETESSDGAGARYVNFNPRLSIIGRLSERHTVRFSAATSYRTPPPFFTLVEAVITPYPAPIPPAYAVARNPLMRPEKLRALEAGYRGRLAYWLRLDGTVFVQRANNVRETVTARVPLESTNSLDESHVGCELAMQLRPSEAIAGHLSYAFLRADSPQYPDDIIRFPPHILSLGARGRFAGKLQARADFNYVAGMRSRGVGFDPTGTVLALNTYSSSVQAILNLRLGYRMNPGTELFAMGTNLLAPLRARESLRQAMRPEAARIGAVFMIGMELKPQ